MNDGPLLSGWERAQALEIGYYAKPQLWRVYLVHVFAERICHESCNGSQAWVENTHTSHGVSTKTWSSTVRYPYTRSFARTYNYILFLGSCSTQGRITCISQNRPQDNLPQFAPRHYCMCKHSLSLAYERIFLRENERAHTYRCTRFRPNSCSIRCDTSKHRQLGNRRQFVLLRCCMCKCSLRKNDAHSQGQRTIVCALILQRTDVRMHSVLSRLRVHPGLQNLHFLAPFTWHSAPIRATPSLHLHSLTTQWQCIDVNLTIVCWDKARTSLNTYEYTVFCRGWRSSQYCMTCISQHHPQSIPRRFAPHHFGTCTNYLPMRSTNARVADSISLVIVTLTKTHSQMHFVLA